MSGLNEDDKFNTICDIMRFKYTWSNPDCIKGARDLIKATEDYYNGYSVANGRVKRTAKALPINSVTKRYLVEAKTERGNTLYIQAHNNIHIAQAKHDSLVEEWEGCKVQVKMIEIPNAW